MALGVIPASFGRLETVVSKNNTTKIPLGAGAAFNGTADDLGSFQELDINVAGEPAIAPGTLYFEFSPDGENWDTSVAIALAGPVMPPLPLRVVNPFVRVRYENGPTPLTQFRLTTVLHHTSAKSLTRFANQQLRSNEPLEVVRAILALRAPSGDYENVDMDQFATESTQLDVLAAIRALDTGFSAPFTGINGDVVTLQAGMPIAQPTTTLVRGVNNSGFALANIIGVVVVGGAVTMPVRALAQGVLTLSTAAWDAVTGGVGGLVPGARYYLGPVLGTLTTTPPITPGEYVTVIGNAISAVTLLIDPEPPILL